MMRRPSLAAVVTAARAGALDHAEALLHEGQFDNLPFDPAALAVKARLLKDRALRLSGEAWRSGLLAAADCYARADELRPQPYTRINTATLSLLANEPARAAALAREVLAWLDSGEDIAETPYYLAAIRAEARLICGEPGAQAALEQAMTLGSGDWSDRATTRRQLRLIVNARGEDTAWLDAFAPPTSLHFAGHLGIAATDDQALRKAIDAELERHRVGFGFGALAAGADIVIAEQLLARGCDLHVVLPTSHGPFAEQSVRPYGADWLARYEACLDAAQAVTETAQVTGDYEPLATLLASEVAMGAACRTARHIDGDAAQLVVVDEGHGPYGDGIGTALIAERWDATGRAQSVLRWPRTADVMASGRKAESEGRADRRLVALLKLGFAGIDDLDEAEFADAVDKVLAPFRNAAAALGQQPLLTLPAGNARFAAFSTPEAAWKFARAALAIPSPHLPIKIAGHYGLAHWLDAPPALVGRTVAQLEGLFDAAMPGILTVSETFASSLFLGASDDAFAEWIGEIGETRIYAVSPMQAGSA